VQALNVLSAPGTDTYSYPTPPTVTQVIGCNQSNNAAINCPTGGNTVLTVIGTGFAESYISIKARCARSDAVDVA
jgi:hypothetical protein